MTTQLGLRGLYSSSGSSFLGESGPLGRPGPPEHKEGIDCERLVSSCSSFVELGLETSTFTGWEKKGHEEAGLPMST